MYNYDAIYEKSILTILEMKNCCNFSQTLVNLLLNT